MNGASPAISIVICTYTSGRWLQLRRCVESLLQQTRPPEEVFIVVDHNSELEQRARDEFRSVTVLPNDAERGLSGARNTGAHAARGDIVVFLDDDAWASPAWLDRLAHGFDDPRTVGAGGKAIAAWTADRPTWFPEEFLWVIGCSYRGLPRDAAPIRNPLGCNMAFRRDAFDKIGGFRSDFGRVGSVPVGAEETEFSIRLQSALPRSRLMYQPDAVVYHEVSRERTTFLYFLHRCFGEGLSKAHLRRVAGSTRGLAAESAYLTTTIPSALRRGLRRGEVKRTLAVIVGVTATALGFVVGTVGGSAASPHGRYPTDASGRC